MDNVGGFTPIRTRHLIRSLLLLLLTVACNVNKRPTSYVRPDDLAPLSPIVLFPTSQYFSNTPSLTISGTCEENALVQISGSHTEEMTCSESGFSFSVTQENDGLFHFEIIQTDEAGNSSAASAVAWTLDRTAPSAPTITSPNSSPHRSNSSTLTVSGACETGSSVSLAGDSTASTTCEASSYTLSVSKSTDGTYNFTVSQTDPAGNPSLTNSSLQWQRNTVVPSAPTITTPALSPLISNGSSLTISGACITGSTVSLSGSASQTFTCASSAYTFSVPQSVDGTYSYSVSQKDSFGNTSASVSQTWIRDTLKPGALLITAPTANPYSSGDTSFSLTGTCEVGATVNLSGSGTSSTICSSGTFSFTITQNSNGTYDYSLTQTDVATNLSAATSFQWVRDDTIPTTPVLSAPSTNPYHSNTNTITITGSCTNGNLINLSGNVIASEVLTPAGVLSQSCPGTSFTFIIQKSADGSYSFSVNQENTTTQITSADASVTWHRDTGVPAAPVITNPASSPYTASGNLTIAGTCETGTTVKITGDLVQNLVCAGGTFSFSSVKSTDATYNYTLNQTDLAGNISGNTTLQWIRDSSLTASPVITLPTVSNYSSNTASLTVSGTCITGNTITLGGSVTAGEVTTPAGALTQTCANNSFQYVIAKTNDGTYSLSFKQTSVGQGDSPLVTLTWTRDTTPPETNITANPTDPNVNFDAIFSFSSPDTTATFECQIDSEAYTSCASPLTLAAVANGAHTFQVRARDNVGNLDPSPASFSWTQQAFKTIALYHFSSGNTYVDSSLFAGLENNGLTDNGGTSAVTGKFTDGLNFNSSTSQFTSKTDNNSLRSLNATMTLEMQVKFNSLPANSAYMVLASKTGSAGNAGWELRVKRQGSNYYFTFHGSSDGSAITEVKSSTFILDTTSFHHIAVTWNKGSVKFYYDGVAKGGSTIGTAGTTTIFPSTASLRLGRGESMSGTVTYFNGVMDEVRLSQVLRWSAAFTAPSSEYLTVD